MTWIPTKEQLPSGNEDILASDGEKCWVARVFYNRCTPCLDSTICTCCDGDKSWNPKYWMPLPQLPNNKKQIADDLCKETHTIKLGDPNGSNPTETTS